MDNDCSRYYKPGILRLMPAYTINVIKYGTAHTGRAFKIHVTENMTI